MGFDRDVFRQALARSFPMVESHPDIAGLLRDPNTLAQLGAVMAEPFRETEPTVVVAPEARGPILGALVARELRAGLVLLRKQNRNHPGADIPIRSAPTWRGLHETFQGRSFDMGPNDRVVVVDDWVTTGSTLRSALALCRVLGAQYLGASVVVNKAQPEVVTELAISWLVEFEDLDATSQTPAAGAKLD